MVEQQTKEPEVDKDALWKELKLKWSALKRTSLSLIHISEPTRPY